MPREGEAMAPSGRLVPLLLGLQLLAISVMPTLRDQARAKSLRDSLVKAPRIAGLSFGRTFENAIDALLESAARGIPIPSSAGAAYRYNPTTGEYERTSDTFASTLFMERPQTLGRGVWGIAVSGQYLQEHDFDGRKVGEDPDPLLINGNQVHFRENLAPLYHIATLNVTYGVTDDLDLNLAVPLAEANFDGVVRRQDSGGSLFAHDFHAFASVEIADVLLRAKYHLSDWQGISSAAGFTARLPTGNPDSALGTGDAELGPYLAVSMLFAERWEPQFNAGFDVDVNEPRLSSAHYAMGLNVEAVKNWLDVGCSLLGRSEVDGRRARSSISALHQTASGPAEAPFLGLNFDRKDYFDAALGARVRLYRTLTLAVNVMHRLNDDGLRNDTWSPVGAIEGTF